jgi:DNA-binding GntR family transcriptional regulator
MVRTMRPGDDVEITLSRGADIFPVRAVLEGAVRVSAMPHHSPNDDELLQLKKNLEKLETEQKKVEGRIKELEGTSPH